MTRFELFWRNVWLAVRRAPHDKKSRRVLLSLLGSVIYFAFWLAYLGQLDLVSALFGAVLLTGGLGLAIFIRWRNNHSTNLLKLSNTSSDPGETGYDEHRSQIATLLLRRAALVDRAGGEAILQDRQFSQEHQGYCRRRTLDIAQQAEQWDLFTEEDRNLLLSQEGSWEWHEILARVAMIEDVRCLRWVLAMDSVLAPFEFIEFDLSPALELTTTPTKVAGEKCLPPWDIRPARNMAWGVMERCIGEGIERGFYSMEEGKARSALLDLKERLENKHGRDLLTGTKTVAESSEEQIRATALVALHRGKILNQVIRYLGAAPSLPIDQFAESEETGDSMESPSADAPQST